MVTLAGAHIPLHFDIVEDPHWPGGQSMTSTIIKVHKTSETIAYD